MPFKFRQVHKCNLHIKEVVFDKPRRNCGGGMSPGGRGAQARL